MWCCWPFLDSARKSCPLFPSVECTAAAALIPSHTSDFGLVANLNCLFFGYFDSIHTFFNNNLLSGDQANTTAMSKTKLWRCWLFHTQLLGPSSHTASDFVLIPFLVVEDTLIL